MLECKNILIGYSGHAFVVADAAIEAGICITDYAQKTESVINPFNLNYIGFEGDENFSEWYTKCDFVLGIGDNIIRHKVALFISSKNKNILNVIQPTAVLSKKISIGNGNFIAKNVCVNALVTIKNYCILNTGCIVEHESVLGNAVHIAPGAVLAGNVTVGDNSFIGANSVIKQGVVIGKNVVIGAGSVVLKNIEDNSVYVGNPAKRIK